MKKAKSKKKKSSKSRAPSQVAIRPRSYPKKRTIGYIIATGPQDNEETVRYERFLKPKVEFIEHCGQLDASFNSSNASPAISGALHQLGKISGDFYHLHFLTSSFPHSAMRSRRFR